MSDMPIFDASLLDMLDDDPIEDWDDLWDSEDALASPEPPK